MKLEAGEPKHWVRVQWGPNNLHAEFVTVRCERCEGLDWMYRAGAERDPGWIARTVAQHNRCQPRPGSLDPWEAGTP